MASAAGDRFAALFGTYCEERVENGLKVWYQDSTVEEIFPALHHHTIDIGFFYADQRRMTAYLQMIERKHLEFVELCQTEPFLYVGPGNPLYCAESVTDRDLKSLKYVQSQDSYSRPDMHLMEGSMNSLCYQNQGQVMVTNNRSLLTQIIRHNASCEYQQRSVSGYFEWTGRYSCDSHSRYEEQYDFWICETSSWRSAGRNGTICGVCERTFEMI